MAHRVYRHDFRGERFGKLVAIEPIPELCIVLNGGFPADWPALWGYLAPVVAAALSAAIAAAWNIALERLKKE